MTGTKHFYETHLNIYSYIHLSSPNINFILFLKIKYEVFNEDCNINNLIKWIENTLTPVFVSDYGFSSYYYKGPICTI